MASFGVNIYRPSASEHGQNITNITMIKKKKKKKQQQQQQQQLCRFIDMYIGNV